MPEDRARLRQIGGERQGSLRLRSGPGEQLRRAREAGERAHRVTLRQGRTGGRIGRDRSRLRARSPAPPARARPDCVGRTGSGLSGTGRARPGLAVRARTKRASIPSRILTRRAATTPCTVSSSTAKMSPAEQSNRFDQTWHPLAASISCTVMRRRLPSRWTPPSSTVETPSCRAISRTSSGRPLKANADVRATTRQPGSCARPLVSSSARPSQKYSWSCPGAMSTNGSTTIEGPAAGADAAVDPRDRRHQTVAPLGDRLDELRVFGVVAEQPPQVRDGPAQRGTPRRSPGARRPRGSGPS